MEQMKRETSHSREKIISFTAKNGAVIGICCVLIAFQIAEPRFMKIDNKLGVLNSTT